MKTIRLTTCRSSIEANLIKDLLQQENIACVLHNENTTDIFGSAVTGWSGVDILVYEEDLGKAQELLQSRSAGEFAIDHDHEKLKRICYFFIHWNNE